MTDPGTAPTADGPGFRRGVRVAVDVGSVRVGVARSDPDGILATPVVTIVRDSAAPDADLARIADVVAEQHALEVLVGLPRSLSGRSGPAARTARAYARRLAGALDVPVRLVDERLTTVTAHQALHAAGRSSRTHRQVVDQVAATVILEQALETERRTGEPAGELVPGTEST
ncbi:Holliday junction resolvase RuvX [Georgenia alba]|uniref:Putative pre-16S rRNA nuclease n=1 Tax=Georgenia alba TaxID=2233858 RepID=A0ABW2QBM8_9MICO